MTTPLARRTFLRGTAAATLSLPFLDAMRPATAAAQNGEMTRPVRSAFVFFPNGVVLDRWKPKRAGAKFELPETLAPLNRHREDILVVSGLAQDGARSHGDGGGDHARNAASFLTCSHPRKTSGADINAGISIDQVIANEAGGTTKLPSLELGLERSQHSGRCDSGYSCAYVSNVSWRGPKVPTSKEVNPQLVFDRLFGGRQESPEDRQRRQFFRRSILDFVADDAQRLQKRLGTRDRAKLDEYLSSVREVERRIEIAARNEASAPAGSTIEIPKARPKNTAERMRLMYDLLTLAFQTDSTRVATFMLANGGSMWSFPDVDVKEGHHQLSHHRNNADSINKLARIDRYLAEQFAYFVDRLKNTPDGDGTLLDHSMVVYGSGVSDGNRHNHDDLPVIVAGRGGGAVRTGRHLIYGQVKGEADRGSAALRGMANQETPMANLFVSMANAHGIKKSAFGDSTGPLPGLS